MTSRTPVSGPIRWAVLGTATIAASTFLPSLAHVGGGEPVLVAGRDPDKAARFAADNGIARGVGGYQTALDDPDVDAVYVALPNSLHAEWTIAALRAGKAVLCEKPLCVDPAETRRVLDVAAAAPGPLWEAFVFAFQPQMRRVRELIAAGAIGTPTEIQAQFHAPLAESDDIRFSTDLAGGVLADIGVYPVRLARLIFDAEATGARASQVLGAGGADIESWGSVDFPGDRRLLYSASFRGVLDPAARILGDGGEIRLSHPYAAGPADRIELRTPDGRIVTEPWGTEELPFTDIIRHIHAVLRGAEEPRHLAVDDAYGTAAVVAALRESAATEPTPVSRSGS